MSAKAGHEVGEKREGIRDNSPRVIVSIVSVDMARLLLPVMQVRPAY